MPPDTEISTSTASNAWPHLKIGMQSSSQQQYKDAGIKREEERASENEWKMEKIKAEDESKHKWKREWKKVCKDKKKKGQ